MQELLEIFDGRTVAIVGNGEEAQDRSAEIDACDVVVRFNHFYNYDGGHVGKRVDVIIQTFTSAWATAENKHADVIRENDARIFCGKKPEQYNPSMVAQYLGPDVCVSDWTKELEPWARFTTGGAFLAWLASCTRNSRFKVFGFPRGAAAEKYFSTDAKRYAAVKDEELAAQARAIAILERQYVFRARENFDPVVVVPVKASSSGAPGKNAVLLEPCVRKLLSLGLEIHLVGDASSLIERVAKVSTLVKPFSAPPPTGEVTDDLRLWRDHTGYHGEVALVQCTAPFLRPEWVSRTLEARRFAPIAATCVKVPFKVSALYAAQGGIYTQLVGSFGAPSVPRQALPDVVRLSGAVWAFHSDALDRQSFYDAGTLRPVIIDEADALDVDTPEDLELAKRQIAEQEKGES